MLMNSKQEIRARGLKKGDTLITDEQNFTVLSVKKGKTIDCKIEGITGVSEISFKKLQKLTVCRES